MLISLHIENFAIVSKLDLDFASGMTALTGETGAGKSIMIDALMLALGERADTSVIRKGADKCDIQASFTFEPNSAPARWLTAHDMLSADGEIYLRRVISAEGRSKSYINGLPFPLQKVKELSETLVDIHGQHQHQTLLNHATHRIQLDQFANHDDLLDEIKTQYQHCQRLKNAIEALHNQESTYEWRDLLQYQIDELEALSIQDGEIQSLHDEHQLLHHAREYLETVQRINNVLNADDSPNIRQNLNYILQLLASLPTENSFIKNAFELINSALIQCDEALDEMNRFGHQVQLDPERLKIVEDRMSELHQAARKYHIETNQLATHRDYLQTELSRLQHAEEEKINLQKAYETSLKDYNQAAIRLRESRTIHAQPLADAITAVIQQLGMPNGYIMVDITPLEKIHIHGMDKVEYKVCTNPGTQPDLLNKIASGGELSRISLAIQMIAAQRGATPTLLFDEVDVGIGGATAALVGKMLRELGQRLQLFCVTHQPQVAACAHHHFRVDKYIENEQTFSRITSLQSGEKIDEIARMLGGLSITEQTRSHARELLEQ